MLKFEKLKLVLFDFDDTLCIHVNRPYDTRDQIEYDAIILAGQDAWSDCIISQDMLKFIQICKQANIPMGLLSSTGGYVRMVGKQKWVQEHYGVLLENYSVCSPARKLEELFSLIKFFKIGPENVLLVDDLYSTLEMVAKEGFQAACPLEITEFCKNK